jgi:hypothetical protein
VSSGYGNDAEFFGIILTASCVFMRIKNMDLPKPLALGGLKNTQLVFQNGINFTLKSD